MRRIQGKVTDEDMKTLCVHAEFSLPPSSDRVKGAGSASCLDAIGVNNETVRFCSDAGCRASGIKRRTLLFNLPFAER